MGMGGFFGLICLYGLLILVKRRLGNERVRATSSTMDIVILFLLLAQLLLGLGSIFVSMGHLDGGEMLLLMSWAHVFLGMTLFVVFPFSRLVHVWSVPVKYFSRNYQVVRSKG